MGVIETEREALQELMLAKSHVERARVDPTRPDCPRQSLNGRSRLFAGPSQGEVLYPLEPSTAIEQG